MMNFGFSPCSHSVTPEFKSIINCFKQIEPQLKQKHAHDVLALVRPHLEQLGFAVGTGKGKDEKIDVPVLFSENNNVDKSFIVEDGKWRAISEILQGREQFTKCINTPFI